MTEVQEKKWYVIRAISGQENKIKTYIEGEIKRLKIDSFVEDSKIAKPTTIISVKNILFFAFDTIDRRYPYSSL